MPDPNGDDPRVPLAIERTLLAWNRTGLALMGFGFLVTKVGGVAEPSGAGEIIVFAPTTVPTIVGVLMLATGALVNFAAAWPQRFGLAPVHRGLRIASGVTALTGVLGIALALYALLS